MPNDTPQTLPANFFDKKGDTPPPQTLPPEFFSKAETKEDGGVKAKPLDLGQATSISAQPSLWQRLKNAAVNQGPLGIGQELGSSMRRPFEQSTIPIPGTGKTVGDATRAQGDWANLAMTTIGLTGGAGIGGPEALEAVGEPIAAKLSTKTEPLARINKLLGVTKAEVVPGKVPSSLEEFAANPARGVMNAGLDEAKLAKMNPLERNAAVMKAKDAAGKQLEQVLEQATQAGKKVDLYPIVDKVFDAIPDAKLAKQTENAFIQLLKEKGVTGPLDQVTPSQARAIQRGVEESLKGEGMADIAAQLRKGISEATKKVVPEAGPADQHYWDLANAAKGTQKLLKQYATTQPKNKLIDWIIKATIGGTAYELGKHFPNVVP